MASSKFANDLCLDVHAEIFGFLEANDQAKLRRTSNYFCTVFNHAFQRGYVAAAIHEGYVDKLDAMHEDGDDGNPLLRVAPVNPKALFGRLFMSKRMHRSTKDEESTLFVNMRLVLGHKTQLESQFLSSTSFLGVHIFGTEDSALERIGERFLCDAKLQTFTMSTPCPRLTKVDEHCLSKCRRLTNVDLSGWISVRVVGSHWLSLCTKLATVSFNGCTSLKKVHMHWLASCRMLYAIDFTDLGALEEVGDFWLSDCASLERLDFGALTSLRSVDEYWMEGCKALRFVDLRGCAALEEIGSRMFFSLDVEGRHQEEGLQKVQLSKDNRLSASAKKALLRVATRIVIEDE